MKLLTLMGKNKVYSLALDNYKIVLSTNENNDYLIHQIFNRYFGKIGDSEIQEYENDIAKVLINQEIIHKKEYGYYNVHPYFDFQTDFKLGSNSLSLKYCEAILSKQENIENIETLNYILQGLETILSDEHQILKPKSEIFSPKSLAKLMTMELLIDEMQANQFDLTLSEAIILQLDMIATIAKLQQQMNFIVLIRVRDVTFNLIHKVESMPQNINCIIITQNIITEIIDIDKIYLMTSKIMIDCAIDEEIDEKIITKLPYYCNVEEVKMEIINSLNDITKCKQFVKDLII